MAENLQRHSEHPFAGTVRLAQESDIPSLRPILETWIRRMDNHEIIREEVSEVLSSVEAFAKGEEGPTYLVAETLEGEVIGMMGLRPPEEKMKKVFAGLEISIDDAAEFINGYVAQEHRGGKGVGKALVVATKKLAREKGYKHAVFNSGPRYRWTGWPIWIRIYGQPITVAKDFYDPGAHALVWRITL